MMKNPPTTLHRGKETELENLGSEKCITEISKNRKVFILEVKNVDDDSNKLQKMY